jgi:hypothetical protein
MSEKGWGSWAELIEEPWDVPAELRSPTPHTETNLTILLLTCPALHLDRQAGKFLVTALEQHDYLAARQATATTDPTWFAAQYMVGQFEQQRIFDALIRFRELEGSDLPDTEVGESRRARRREVEAAIGEAIQAYETAMSQSG